MSGLDWRRAKVSGRRLLSVQDEAEFRDKDAAARWLSKREKPVQKPRPAKPRAKANWLPTPMEEFAPTEEQIAQMAEAWKLWDEQMQAFRKLSEPAA